jgi:hypothetical protein
MRRVVSLFLPHLAIERLRRLDRHATRPPERPALQLPVDDDPGACSVPRGGGWRPGARWARADMPTRQDVEGEIAALPAHAKPPMRELGRRSEAANHPFHGPAQADIHDRVAATVAAFHRAPLALVGKVGRREEVVAACDGAAALGITIGVAATHARALTSDLDIRPSETEADAALLDQLALRAVRRWSPIAAATPPDGLPEDLTSSLAGQVWGWSAEGVGEKQVNELNLDIGDRRLRLTLELARKLIGVPRHMSQHPGGFVLIHDGLDDLVPIEPAAMEDRQIIEWDKDDIDALKFMKVDVLGLGMLGCMNRAFNMLEADKGLRVSYASSWMKHHHPDVFCASLMNAQPMGFYAPAQIVRDAREHGVVVRPPCVNASRWDCTLEPYGGRYLAVRLGLRQIRGLSNADGAKIVGARELVAFESVEDVWRRSGVQRAAIEKLPDGDAFHSFGADRRQGLWKVRGLGEAPLPLFAAADRADQAVSAEGIEPDVELRPLTDGREVIEITARCSCRCARIR